MLWWNFTNSWFYFCQINILVVELWWICCAFGNVYNSSIGLLFIMVAWPSKCFWLRNNINATIENAIIQNTFCKTLIEYSAPLSKFWLHILSDNEHKRCLMNKVFKLAVLKLVGPCRHLLKIYWGYILYFFCTFF